MASDLRDFEAFYKRWYFKAIRFALEYIRDESEAENIVQEVFVNIFEKRKSLSADMGLTFYLFAAVKNRCINYLTNKLRQRSLRVSDGDAVIADRLALAALEEFDVEVVVEDDLEQRLDKALEALPPRCRQIFVMSRIEGKKQDDIAAELGISINTVESQMKIAYIKLRTELKDFVK